ncbi:MAG TPA: MFS transporter [Candidatus Paceibacterota bacterium]|nr:MFS transporter [Candidatus Paceibacterota bacterium]HRZ34682.1 MFS transporter [Candidatus Paceibacterota bacterium]
MKKKIAYWALYDFANSFVQMAYLFYFSQWLVIDQGKPAWWYNLALILSSILFFLTAPYIGKVIDTSKKKIVGLRTWTALSFIGFIILALLMMLTNGQEILATTLFIFSTYAYLVSFLYYTPILNDLSTRENCSWVSGIGFGANSIGQVLGILLTIPFVSGITLFGDPGRAQALLPATILFGLLSIPMVFLYREEKVVIEVVENQDRPTVLSLFKSVFSHKSLAFILIAYFLFSDSLLTFANNFPLYLETVFKATDTTKSLLTAGILILSAFGALILGKVSDKIGNVKILKIIIVIWCLLLFSMAATTNFGAAIPIFLFAGILFGPIFSISRSLVGQLSPENLRATSYSYLVLAERFATFIGPAVWSTVLIVVGETVNGYRSSVFSLGVLLLISLLALNRIKEPVRGNI